MIDTHAHLNSEDIKDLDNQIKTINASSLDAVVNIGLDRKTSIETIDIANNNPKFFATIGIHPLHNGNPSDILDLYNNNKNDKIVAIGEIGLDDGGNLETQILKFIEMIEIANLLKLPIVIHSKNANSKVIDIIKLHMPEYGFVFHCFQPDIEILKEIILLGGYISVASPITRPTARKSLEVIKIVPIDRLLIELDYPYMSQNTEVDGRKVFNKIEELKQLKKRELESILDGNAKRLFKKMQK